MPSAILRVTPSDYDAWHALHLAVVREHGAGAGLVSEAIYRDHDEPGTIVVIQQLESIERFREFLATPFMQDTIAKAPIEAPPTVWFVDEEETIDVLN